MCVYTYERDAKNEAQGEECKKWSNIGNGFEGNTNSQEVPEGLGKKGNASEQG
jgi:hypothetical protein